MKQKLLKKNYVKFLEFPDLLFASDKDGNVYFNAIHYIKQKGCSSNITPLNFARTHLWWFDTVADVYGIQKDSLMICEKETGHVFIDEALALLFVAYTDPLFGIHILDRVAEMLLNGFVLSDSRITLIAHNRLNLKTNINNDK